MSDFRIDEKVSDGVTALTISGPINELSNFRPVSVNPTITVSFSQVSRLNSVGTRKWCQWVRTLGAATQVTLRECPVVLVNTFNQVEGTLLPNMTVESFYVPFYSEKSGERKDILFKAGVEFDETGALKPPSVKDSDGNEMEMDIIHNSYSRFLKKQ